MTIELIKDGSKYCVEKDGVQVFGPGNYDQAMRFMERIEREARIKKRNCMTCGKKFASEGAHNRMCNDCRKTSIYDGAS